MKKRFSIAVSQAVKSASIFWAVIHLCSALARVAVRGDRMLLVWAPGFLARLASQPGRELADRHLAQFRRGDHAAPLRRAGAGANLAKS